MRVPWNQRRSTLLRWQACLTNAKHWKKRLQHLPCAKETPGEANMVKVASLTHRITALNAIPKTNYVLLATMQQLDLEWCLPIVEITQAQRKFQITGSHATMPRSRKQSATWAATSFSNQELEVHWISGHVWRIAHSQEYICWRTPERHGVDLLEGGLLKCSTMDWCKAPDTSCKIANSRTTSDCFAVVSATFQCNFKVN